MKLYYEGTDISHEVEVRACRHFDRAGEADCLEMVLGQAEKWLAWKPQRDDRMEVRRGGYSTGELYLHAVIPEDGNYRIVATAAKSGSRWAKNESFAGKTLETIVKLTAAEVGMGYRLWGIDGGIRYHYLLRENQGAAAFLQGIAEREGCVVKTYGGNFLLVSLAAAQGRQAGQTIPLTARMPGVRLTRRWDLDTAALTVTGAFGAVTARDGSVDSLTGRREVVSGLPAADKAEAGRMARGLLVWRNFAREELEIESTFQEGWTALGRIDTVGEVSGEWVIWRVEQDLKDGRSRGMLRKVSSGVV